MSDSLVVVSPLKTECVRGLGARFSGCNTMHMCKDFVRLLYTHSVNIQLGSADISNMAGLSTLPVCRLQSYNLKHTHRSLQIYTTLIPMATPTPTYNFTKTANLAGVVSGQSRLILPLQINKWNDSTRKQTSTTLNPTTSRFPPKMSRWVVSDLQSGRCNTTRLL